MPFDPCGMIMDMLRAGYKTKVKPFFDSPTLVDIIWFFAAPGAKVFPGHHNFSSLLWEDPRIEGTIGERKKGFPFYNGKAPFPIGFEGVKFCGTKEMFVNGASILDPPLAQFEFTTECCLPFPLPGFQYAKLKIKAEQDQGQLCSLDIAAEAELQFLMWNTGVFTPGLPRDFLEDEIHWYLMDYTFQTPLVVDSYSPDPEGDDFSRWIRTTTIDGGDTILPFLATSQPFPYPLPVLRGRMQIASDIFGEPGPIGGFQINWGLGFQNVFPVFNSGAWTLFAVDPLGFEGLPGIGNDAEFSTNWGLLPDGSEFRLRVEFGDFVAENPSRLRIAARHKTQQKPISALKVAARAYQVSNIAALKISSGTDTVSDTSAVLRIAASVQTLPLDNSARLRLSHGAASSAENFSQLQIGGDGFNASGASLQIACKAQPAPPPNLTLDASGISDNVCLDCVNLASSNLATVGPPLFGYAGDVVLLCGTEAGWQGGQYDVDSGEYAWVFAVVDFVLGHGNLAIYRSAETGFNFPITLTLDGGSSDECTWPATITIDL